MIICGAKTRSGGECRRRAGTGTDHLGAGNCKLHGGASPNGVKHAAKLWAIQLASELKMEPHDALLWMVRRAAGEVVFWTRRLENVTDPVVNIERVREWTGGEHGGGEETITSNDARLHIEVVALHDAEERLAKFAKMAVDAGVAERQVRLAEQYGADLADALRHLLDELNLNTAQRKLAPAAIRRTFEVLEGGVGRAAA